MSKKQKHKPPARQRTNPWVFLAIAFGLLACFFGLKQLASKSDPAAPGSVSSDVQERFRVPPDAETFARYAGSQSCQACHAEAFASWSQSHHGLAERSVQPGLDQAAFHPPQQIQHGTQSSEARLEGNICQIITLGPDGKQTPFPAGRVIGVEPLRQFLIAFPNGRHQVSELAFDPVQNDWFNIFGNEDRQPGEWGHWTGRGMTWNQMCASCHNTRLRKNYDSATDSYRTSMAEMSVGCESCHGPMKAHVDWQKDRPQPARGDPTLQPLDRKLMMETCAPCHARRGEIVGDFEPGARFLDHYFLTIPDETDLYYADGQVREENYEYASFQSSRMFAAGVSCMDCHQPHSAKLLALDNHLCQRCHGPPVAPAPKIDPAAHSFHIPDTPGGRCVDCHMPLTTYMQRDPRRDHGFTIPDPLLTKEFGIPNACNRCHAERDSDWALARVESWYGAKMDHPRRARAQAIARARAGQTNAIPELERLAREEPIPLWRGTVARLLERWSHLDSVKSLLREKAGDSEPLVRAQAAHALAPLVGLNDAHAIRSLQFLLNDPFRAVRVEAAWALHATLDTNSLAGRELLHSLAFNADQPSGALQYGVFELDRGRPAVALDWFQKAVAWDGRSAPLRDSLAVCLSVLGRPGEAVRHLEAACRLEPQTAQYRYRLGLALNEVGQLSQAIAALEEAVKIDPQLSPAWYNLGLGYSSANRPEEAVQALVRAETIDPRSARIPYARATVLAKLNRVEEARRAAARALEIEPNYAEAAQLLQMLSNPFPLQ